MTGQCKPSEGPWISTFGLKKQRGVRNSGGFICFLTAPNHYSGQDERYEEELADRKCDSDLIAEAGTVYHETKLTPRQLLAQRDELLKALKVAWENCDPLDMTYYDTGIIEAAIANAEKEE